LLYIVVIVIKEVLVIYLLCKSCYSHKQHAWDCGVFLYKKVSQWWKILKCIDFISVRSALLHHHLKEIVAHIQDCALCSNDLHLSL